MKCPFMKEKNYSEASNTHTPLSQCSDVAKDCIKDECALWVKLTSNKQEQGRCVMAWLPVLLVELRGAIENNREDKK